LQVGASEKWGIVFGSKQGPIQDEAKLRLKRFPFAQTPLETFQKIQDACDFAFLLESVEGPRKLARYSFVGFNPSRVFVAKNQIVQITDLETNERTIEKRSDPLNLLERIVSDAPVNYKGMSYVGGSVGYISYDAVRYWENLPTLCKDDFNFPDIEMGIYSDGIIFDHRNRQAFYFYTEKDRLAEIRNLLERNSSDHTFSHSDISTNIPKERFEEMVSNAKEHIRNGRIFQVVLSKRYEFKIEGDLLRFYHILRKINPSPYMFFLKMRDRVIVGSSPETLMRIRRGVIESFPIAGTRPRFKVSVKDRRLARELLSDEKECAEHAMLVDLARNDVGHVSEFGTVKVAEYMKVQRFSHVQHMVSRVVGTLRDNCNSFDALRACFPAGTVSGAPKVSAMEIIEESESTRRGPYAGAVGYFSSNGDSDFAITIRTLVVNGKRASVQVGAGIVADSQPEREWYETEQKAGALLKALEQP
jgi:anthranilate synthase component 1